MNHLSSCLIAAVLLSGAAAHAAGGHHNWKSVRTLAGGVPIEVKSVGQAGLEECRVVSSDDVSLTCERSPDANVDWRPGDVARIVFPRDAVERVWVWEDSSDRNIWIGLGLGFGIGALACSPGGPAAAFICAGIGFLIASAVELAGPPAPRQPYGVWMPGGPPRRQAPQFYRKLWYQQAAPRR